MGPPLMGAGAIGEQTWLLLLDAVLHLATGTADLVVELPGIAVEIGGDKAWVLTASSNPGRRSACRSNNRPPSLVISPPENRASIRRRFTGGKSKLTWVHSVMGKVQFEFTVTN